MELSSIRFEILTDLPGPYCDEANVAGNPGADQFWLEFHDFAAIQSSPAITTVRTKEKRQEPLFVGRQRADYGLRKLSDRVITLPPDTNFRGEMPVFG